MRSAPDLFADLPASCIEAIEKASKIQNVRSGHMFFRTAEAGGELFRLVKGSVQTYRTSGTKKLIIADLKPPALFGEMGCVGQCIYHCCAQTSEPSKVQVISRSDLEAILGQCPMLTRRLLDLVSQRFVGVLMDLDATSFQLLIPRLANLLLERAEGHVVHNVTHKDLAQHLRVYRESVTAALGELKKAGIIEIKRKEICILQLPRLQRAARE